VTPEGDPVPRARESARWLTSLAFLGLVAAGVVAAAVLLWRSVDLDAMIRSEEPDVAENPVPTIEPDPPATAGGGFRVALLASEASAGFLDDPDAGHGRQADRWRALADSLGGSVTEVSGEDGVTGLEPGAVVVVPVAPCLPFGVGMALFRHLRDGGGLVIEGPVASRDEACEWRGWSVLRSLTGAESVREVRARDGLFLTVPAGLPFSHGLAPGSRVEMWPDLQVAVAADDPGAYWSDFGLSPASPEGADDAVTGALSRRTESGGRMVWLGFLGTDGARELDARRLRRLQGNALLWAARRPLASLAAWPDGREAALLVTEDVEAEPQNARVLADVLRRIGLPGTFFVVHGLVEGEDEIAEAVASAGEVGTHTFDHQTLAGRSPDDQRVRLRRSRRATEDWSGREVRGLRPPEERFDSVTLAAWADAGGDYVAAENQARSAAPELHRTGAAERPMVVVPRVMKDDYNVLVNDGLGWDRGVEAMMGGFRKVRRLGGVALLNLHTQFVDMGRAERLGAVLDSVAAEPGWWTTTAGKVADWWRVRHAAGVTIEATGGDSVLEVAVAAPPDTALTEATVAVSPGGDPGAWEVEPGRGGPGLGYRVAPPGLQVVVDSVAAGDTARFRLRRTGSGAADDGGGDGELSRPGRPGGP
jgi:peptidoglycan/xylan/chitin deacetylase (PgdA/CDA1 family)